MGTCLPTASRRKATTEGGRRTKQQVKVEVMIPRRGKHRSAVGPNEARAAKARREESGREQHRTSSTGTPQRMSPKSAPPMAAGIVSCCPDTKDGCVDIPTATVCEARPAAVLPQVGRDSSDPVAGASGSRDEEEAGRRAESAKKHGKYGQLYMGVCSPTGILIAPCWRPIEYIYIYIYICILV